MDSILPSVFGIRGQWRPGDLHIQAKRIQNQQETVAHEHAFHEIVYVESGTVDHITVAGTRKLIVGDVITLKPHMWHQYRNPRSFTIVNCLFENALLRRYGAMLQLGEGVFQLFCQRTTKPREKPPRVLHAHPAQRTDILNTLETMMSEIRDTLPDWQVVVTVRLLDFLVTVARLGYGTELRLAFPPLANRALEAVVETVEYLEKHFKEVIMLNDLAKQFHISPFYLSRTFKKRMGMGIVQYLHHLRIEEACRLLRYSDEPITTVANNVGYDQIAYFSRRFCEETGVSPRKYRATYKSVGANSLP